MGTELNDAALNQPTTETELQCALHEVSNALTVVLGWLRVAESEVELTGAPAPATGDLARAVAVAQSHAQRAHRVARSAIGANSHAAPERYRSSLLRLAIEAASPTAQSREVSLQALAPKDTDSGLDPSHKLNIGASEQGEVLQILLNLVLNAIAFTPSTGSVRVSVREQDQQAIWTVSDDGPGVPATVRPTVFVRGTSGRPGGAGIGLCHSMELAARRGGDLRLLPATAGEGATFELVWPLLGSASNSTGAEVDARAVSGMLEPQARRSEPTERNSMRRLQGLRVLVLEDDAAVSAMLEFGLESKGVRVTCASDVNDFNAALEKGGGFDAALLDYSPIQADPEGAMAALKSSQGDMPVILISGSAIAPQARLPIKLWVQKPFELSEVYDALLETLSGGSGSDDAKDASSAHPSGERSSVRATASSTVNEGECAAG